METIRARLADEKSARRVRGARLVRSGLPKVALVGYTNAGKTTILNALAGETRSSADRLFETLETTTRLVSGEVNPNNTKGTGDDGGAGPPRAAPDFVVTDTVGFIRKLPTQLVHSFASTLEAAEDADVLVVCADAASEALAEEVRAVEGTLASALSDGEGDGGPSGEVVLCLNKSDLLDPGDRKEVERGFPGALLISAREDVSPLRRAIREAISGRGVRMEVLIPHSEYGEATRLYGLAEIHARSDTERGLLLDITLPKARAQAYARYRTAS
jgi:GTP-binding protein HflX